MLAFSAKKTLHIKSVWVKPQDFSESHVTMYYTAIGDVSFAQAFVPRKKMNRLKKLIFPYLLILYEVVLYLSNDMYLPSMPTIASDLSLNEHEIQATLTFWFLGASSLQLILGPISDRFGRRVVILCGAVAFIIASGFCAVATSLTTLLIARLIQGTAVCTLVAGYAAVHETFATKQAIKLFAIIGAVTILAPALGPLFGSILVQFATWRYIFWFLAAFGLITIFALFFYLPETNTTRKKIDLPNIASDYRKIISNKDFLIPCLSYFLIVAVEFLWAFESPFIMIEVYKTSILFYGIAQTIIFGCFLMGAAATKWLLDRYTVKILIKYGTFITLLGTLAFWLVSAYYPVLLLGIACMMIVAMGSSMLVAPLTRLALEACRQPAGMTTAIFTAATNLAGATIGIVLSLIYTTSLFIVANIMIVCIALAAVLIMYLRICTTTSTSPNKPRKFKTLFLEEVD